MSEKNAHEPETDSESLEEALLAAAQAQAEWEARERQQKPRSREELKAAILAFLRLLPDAPKPS
jgi:hypothetical protein